MKPGQARILPMASCAAITLAAMGLLTLTTSAQTTPQTPKTTLLAQTPERLAQDVTLRDVVTVPVKVMGRKVTIEGVVSKVYSNRLFIIRGKGDAKNMAVPILAKAPIPGQYGRPDATSVRLGDPVQVTGTVTRFEIEEMQKTTGARYVERDYRVFLSKPALLATFAVVQPGGAGPELGATPPPDKSQPMLPITSDTHPPIKNQRMFVTFPQFMTFSDKASMVGKPVKINTVKVLSVISDRGFYVGDTPEKRLFCVLDHSLDDGKMDQAVVVKKGQTLGLEGTVEKMPTEAGALKRWTVDKNEAAMLAKQPVFLHVRFIHFK